MDRDSAANPLLTIETVQETKVQEITYDGQEIPQPPLLMSENLAKLASRIDWSLGCEADSDSAVNTAADSCSQTSAASAAPAADEQPEQASWPWESVRDKIRNAYTELCVLSDTLSIARHKRYMVLDAVTQDAPEPRILVQVISKKKALQGAVQILMEGAERMRENLAEQKRSRALGDFYTELQRLRHDWRVRKVGNSIVGSLSYRHVGSQFWLPGTFDVKKCDVPSQPTPVSAAATGFSPAAGGVQQSVTGAVPCPLAVVIPSELQGSAHVSVRITSDGESPARSAAAIEVRASLTEGNSGASSGDSPNHWRQQLQAAQNVLFCRELVSQLASEAVEADWGRPHLVVGSRITSQLFDGVTMVMELVHTPPESKPERSSGEQSGDKFPTDAASAGSCGDSGASDTVLAHSLHQLLRQLHHSSMSTAAPHPASAPLGPCKRRRLAGPGALSRTHLIKLIESETILERIVRQARHAVLRQRVVGVLEEWCVGSADVSSSDPLSLTSAGGDDPLLTCHWLPISSAEQCCCKVNLLSHGYDAVQRTTLLVHVQTEHVRCVTREGRVICLGADPAELQYTLLCQVVQHNVSAAQNLARMLGWTVVSSSSWRPSSGGAAAVDSCASCQLLSPAGGCSLTLRCWPEHPQLAVGVDVTVSQSAAAKQSVSQSASSEQSISPSEAVEQSVSQSATSEQLVSQSENSEEQSKVAEELLSESQSQRDRLLVRDSWKQLSHHPPKQVDWDRMPGRNFLNKLELLLANITSESPPAI